MLVAAALAESKAKGFLTLKNRSKSKDGSSSSKGFTKLAGSDIYSKRKAFFTEKLFESWNKAKSRLIEKGYNKRRRSNACINCGEVGHLF